MQTALSVIGVGTGGGVPRGPGPPNAIIEGAGPPPPIFGMSFFQNRLTLLRAKSMEYYGIAHAFPRCKKCFSYKQLRECDNEKVFSS